MWFRFFGFRPFQPAALPDAEGTLEFVATGAIDLIAAGTLTYFNA